MYLVIQREGDSAPTRYEYNPKKMMAPECEAIEKKTGLTFEQFHAKLVEGSALCRRALLWVMIKRQHAGTKFEDVNFAWGECELRFHKEELEDMKAAVLDVEPGPERDTALRQIDEMLAEAEEGGETGKAPSAN